MNFKWLRTLPNVPGWIQIAGVIAAIIAAVVGVLTFMKPDTALKFSTYDRINREANHVIRNPSEANRLFIELETAADHVDTGALSKQDSEQLAELLKGFTSLRNRPEVCAAWHARPRSREQHGSLARIVHASCICIPTEQCGN